MQYLYASSRTAKGSGGRSHVKIFDRLINSCSARVAYIVLEQRASRICFLETPSTPFTTLRGKRGRWRGAFGLQSHRIGCTTAPRNQRASRPLRSAAATLAGTPASRELGAAREAKISSHRFAASAYRLTCPTPTPTSSPRPRGNLTFTPTRRHQ